MDRNTNNSFTSAPQGGDYSDIIIPSAYATKPKNKNLKKFVLLGAGVLAIIILAIILIKVFTVNPKSMSSKDFIALAESEDMEKITDLESLLDYIYNGSVSFSDIMNDKTHDIINTGLETFQKENSLLSQKSRFQGPKNIGEMYDTLRKDFSDRLNRYQKSIKIYNDIYEAYNNYDSSILTSYTQDTTNFGEYFKKIIDSINELKSIDDSLIQIRKSNSNEDEGSISRQSENILDKKNQVIDKLNLSVNPKFIFNDIYSEKDYEQEDLLKTSIDKIVTNIRK